MKRLLWLLAFLMVAAAVYFYYPAKNKDSADNNEDSKMLSATVLSPEQNIHSFNLTDTTGNDFSHQSLKGHWTLLFFGYATCPDICPRTLTQVQKMYSLLSKNKNLSPRFIFVSLDPKSDTKEKLSAFLSRFNPSFIGVTGAESEIKKLSQTCRIYSTELANSTEQQKLIDHSANLLLINPQGKIQAIFSPPHHPDNIAHDLPILMDS